MQNYEKAEAYALLKVKMKIALKNNFWLKVCMIEYAIIEDRTVSILTHTGIVKDASCKKLSKKLNSIEYQIADMFNGKDIPIGKWTISSNIDEKSKTVTVNAVYSK